MFEKLASRAAFMKQNFSPHSGKNTLRSINGHRCLSRSAKIAFFADLAGERPQLDSIINPSAERIRRDVREHNWKSLKHGTSEDLPGWLFDSLSKAGGCREVAVHLGLDLLFFVAMCISHADPTGKQYQMCYFGKMGDLTKDRRNCYKGRLLDMRLVNLEVEPYERDMEAMGMGLTAQLRRLVGALEGTLEISDDKREAYESKKRSIFADMERTCSNGPPPKVIGLAWDSADRPEEAAGEDVEVVKVVKTPERPPRSKRSSRSSARKKSYRESGSEGKEVDGSEHAQDSEEQGGENGGKDSDEEEVDDEEDEDEKIKDADFIEDDDEDEKDGDASYREEPSPSSDTGLQSTGLDAEDEEVLNEGEKDDRSSSESKQLAKGENAKRKLPSSGKPLAGRSKKQKSSSPNSAGSVKKEKSEEDERT